ncbi:MAG: ABC transporter substrate-binding protein [Bacteroidota bacterium]
MKEINDTILMKLFRLSLIATALAISCSNNENKHLQEARFDNNSIVSRAGRFSLEKTDSCTLLTITDPWQGAKDIKKVYFLVDRNEKLSETADKNSVIYVPVEKMICMSTTHVAMVSALGHGDAIVGVSGAGFMFSQEISEKIKRGNVYDVGYEAGMNNELILSLSPDLIMMYGIGSESAGYLSKVQELGIKVMFNADYLENDPLAKTEWIKLFGALFCEEEKADSLFRTICLSYDQIKSYIEQNAAEKPDVLLGLPFRDTWFISPGDSYAARFIADAGGNYLWHETRSSVSMPYSLEVVYIRSLKADFWINTGSAGSKKEIISLDPRLEKIPPFRNGNLYNNNKRVSLSGGNDYWESGILQPHIILKDIAAILHPDLFPGYELYYYSKLE